MGPNKEAGERLLIEAAQNDASRFADLYELHFARVYAYVTRRVSSREESQDITSEVFHQALANIKTFEWRGVPFAVWLYRIAANAIADRWRRQARERGKPVPGEPSEAGNQDDEDVARLFRLVDSLPTDQRRVIELRFGDEKTIREVAEALGRTEGAVKQLQFRAIENLRARVGESNG